MPNVTEIGEGAFAYCYKLATLRLPLVTEIGPDAFLNCRCLTTLHIPLVTEISRWVFKGCTNLITMDLPNITKVGEQAFVYCNRLTLVFMPNVLHVDNGAFSGCENLTTIFIPSVTHIGHSAFPASSRFPERVSITTNVFVGPCPPQIPLDNLYYHTNIYCTSIGVLLSRFVALLKQRQNMLTSKSYSKRVNGKWVKANKRFNIVELVGQYQLTDSWVVIRKELQQELRKTVGIVQVAAWVNRVLGRFIVRGNRYSLSSLVVHPTNNWV